MAVTVWEFLNQLALKNNQRNYFDLFTRQPNSYSPPFSLFSLCSANWDYHNSYTGIYSQTEWLVIIAMSLFALCCILELRHILVSIIILLTSHNTLASLTCDTCCETIRNVITLKHYYYSFKRKGFPFVFVCPLSCLHLVSPRAGFDNDWIFNWSSSPSTGTSWDGLTRFLHGMRLIVWRIVRYV